MTDRYHRPMRTMRRLSLGPVIVLSLAVPHVAAGRLVSPPGKAGVNQYTEDLPSSQGGVAPPYLGGGSAPPGAIASLGRGRAGAAALSHLGKAGQSAAAFARETAPIPARPIAAPRAQKPGAKTRSVPGPTYRTSGSSTAGAVADALGGSGSSGLGLVFPILLILSLVGAAGLGAWRLRSRHAPTADSI